MKQFKFFYSLILGLIFLPVAAQTPQNIFEDYSGKICLVQYYKNVSSQSQIGSYIKIKQYRIGIIVSPDGLIMVNSDVYPLSLDIISGEGASFSSGEPTDFKVKIGKEKEYKARFIGKDDLSQVAFLKISDDLSEPLPFVEFSPTDEVNVGDSIFLLELLNESYQFQPLFTQLQVNAIIPNPRKKFVVNNYVPALSAGGLVIDEQGKAIGITLRTEISFDFMTPSDFEDFQKEYLEIAPSEWFTRLIEHPPVLQKTRYQGKAWLGIGMQALTEALKEYWKLPVEGGVVVDRVYPNSPAQKAGLKIQDVIVAFNEQPLRIRKDEELNQFRELITRTDPETKVQLTIYRAGKKMVKEVQLKSAPPAIDLAPKLQLSKLGIEVREVTYDVRVDYNFPEGTSGVYVYQVDPASPAGMGGLEVGSVITHVNGKKVSHLSDFQKVVNEALQSGNEKIMFQVL
ncbi:MAG: PDZ domain-containing protein, partial [Calditrichaeota bacterium]